MAAGRFTLDPSIRALLRDLHIPAGRLLRRAQLPAGILRGGPVALSTEEYFRLWDALDAEADDPNLAVAIGQAISVEMFSPPLFAALCSPNLEVAARRIATYKPLIGPMVVGITQDSTGLTVTYGWPAGMTPPQLLATTELVFWVALARIATRHHVRPARVTVRQLPADPGTAAEYFGVNLRTGPTESISFAAEDVTRPFLTENEPMWRFFAPELRSRLADLHAAASAAERVRAALLETLPGGRPHDDHRRPPSGYQPPHPPAATPGRRHQFPSRPHRHPRAPGPPLSHPQRHDHRRDRLPARL